MDLTEQQRQAMKGFANALRDASDTMRHIKANVAKIGRGLTRAIGNVDRVHAYDTESGSMLVVHYNGQLRSFRYDDGRAHRLALQIGGGE